MALCTGFGRLLRWVAVPTIVVGLLAHAAPFAHADNPSAELEQANDKLKYIYDQKAKATNEFQQVNWQALEAQEQLSITEKDLLVATNELNVITAKLGQAQQELELVEADLKSARQHYEERKGLLASRLRAINEAGRVNYLGVLLGSNTFSDFISRFDMLKLVVNQDASLFEQIRQERKELEQKQEEAIARRNQLALLKQQAEEHRTDIERKREERQVAARSLDSRKRELRSQLAEFDRQEQAVMEMITEIQRRMNRQAGRFVPIYPVRSPIRITDNFGPRLHPILGTWRQHNGTDFAANYGDPVYAIEDGVVIASEWNDAFGWLVVIDHGGGVASWYAHSSKILVKTNQHVKQGQQIQQAGSTGWSTGPHVHLEIRVDGKAEDPLSYIK